MRAQLGTPGDGRSCDSCRTSPPHPTSHASLHVRSTSRSAQSPTSTHSGTLGATVCPRPSPRRIVSTLASTDAIPRLRIFDTTLRDGEHAHRHLRGSHRACRTSAVAHVSRDVGHPLATQTPSNASGSHRSSDECGRARPHACRRRVLARRRHAHRQGIPPRCHRTEGGSSRVVA